VGDNTGFQRRGRENAAGFMKTLEGEDVGFQSGRQRWFPKKGKRKRC